MRRFSGFLGIAIVLVGTAQAALAGGPVEQVEAFHTALQKGDREGALSVLSEKVQIFESGWVERSRAEYAAHHLDSDIEFSKAVKSETNDITVLVDGAIAYVTSEGTMKGVFEGAPVNSVNLETAVLQRVGDNWKIVHIHWSSRKVK
jgi:ketosteroid isomerase-like protein